MRAHHEEVALLRKKPQLLPEVERLQGTAENVSVGRDVGAGAALVREVEGFLKRFVVLPAGALLPVALWTVMTHTYQTFDALPYLALTSPVKRCGKTRLMEVLELLAANARRIVNISEAALFRLIEQASVTLLLDEAEALAGRSERAEAIRALLNSGNRKGSSVPRCVGKSHEVKEFSVFCPKVLAGIGGCPDTIRDRSILLPMQRRKPSEAVERFLHRTVKPSAEALRVRAATFVETHHQKIETAYKGLNLDFLSDRDAEAWEPLFAVLAVADPQRRDELRKCAEKLTAAKAESDEDDSLSLRLLSDVRTVWKPGQRTMLTADILSRLADLEESPWHQEVELNPRKLARMLRSFRVGSQQVRTEKKTGKGYRREDLEPAFSSYLSR
jgi:hypothetical protein